MTTPDADNPGRFQYTGQMWLGEVGLYHYKSRTYAPGLGRFLQADPIGYLAGMNLYAYAGNDPVNNVDPWGLDEACPEPSDTVVVTGTRPPPPDWMQDLLLDLLVKDLAAQLTMAGDFGSGGGGTSGGGGSQCENPTPGQECIVVTGTRPGPVDMTNAISWMIWVSGSDVSRGVPPSLDPCGPKFGPCPHMDGSGLPSREFWECMAATLGATGGSVLTIAGSAWLLSSASASSPHLVLVLAATPGGQALIVGSTVAVVASAAIGVGLACF